MKRIVCLLTLTATLLMPQFSYAGPRVIDLSHHTRRNAAVRSTLLPGWGQFFNQQDIKGYIIAGGAVAALGSGYLAFRQAENTYDDYEKAGLRNGSLYNDYESQQQQAFTLTAAGALIWIYGIIDAACYGAHVADTALTNREGFTVACAGNSVGLCYRKKFGL